MVSGFSPEEFERELRRRIEQAMREFSRFMDSVLRAAGPVISRASMMVDYLVPEHEIYVDGDEVVAVIQLPGASKDSIGVSVRERDLLVEAGFSEELREKAPRARLFRLKGYRFFIELPRDVDPSAAKAIYRDGVLILRLPAQKPKGVKIEIE
jgi:HSP20 family protein